MADPWEPEEEFLEFLEFLQEQSGTVITLKGKNLVDLMRDGTPEGRQFYEKMYNDPFLQDGFEEWKSMK